MSSSQFPPAVRYGLKGNGRSKVKSRNSPAAGDLFDKLKSSVTSKSTTASTTITKQASKDQPERENHQGRATNYSFKYSYSHSPRSQVKVSSSSRDTPSLRGGSLERPSASGPTTSDEKNGHGRSEVRVSKEKENLTKNKDLKVFDFDLSGDEDDFTSEGGASDKKKAKKNNKGSLRQNKEPVTSKKQTLLRQYMNVQSTTTSSSSSAVPKKKKNGKDSSATRKQQASSSKNGQTAATVSSVRDTISKLLASKAEELAAKAASQAEKLTTKPSSQVEEFTMEASSEAEELANKKDKEGAACPDVSATSTAATTTLFDEKTAPVKEEEASGLLKKSTKRKNPLPTTVVAAKKAPPKRARLEREESATETVAMVVAPATGVSSSQPSESSQTSQSGAKKNSTSGTLEKSEIALRTRSSRKLSHEATNEAAGEGAKTADDPNFDSQPLSIANTDEDMYSPSCHEDKELGQRMTESPKSPESSNSELPRGGRPSPRYTARGRRMSNLSPELKRESSAASALLGLEEPGVSLVMTRKPAGIRGTEYDPYTLDPVEDSTLEKTYLRAPSKPSMRKSFSASAYSLTSRSGHVTDSSSLSKMKTVATVSGQTSQLGGPSSLRKQDDKSGPPFKPAVLSLTKSSSWPSRPSVSAKQLSSGSSNLVGSQRLLPRPASDATSSAAIGGVICAKDEKPLYTVIRNVRQAHECLEIGESQQFFDEVHYLLDSIRLSQPLGVRCLGVFNLSTHYFDAEFSRQLRAHSLTPKIASLLKDCLQHPTLCLSAAVLFYVMTRDKLNTEWDENGAGLLVGMLSKKESFFTSELTTGKAQREMTRLKAKAKTILEKVQEQTSVSPSSSQSILADEAGGVSVGKGESIGGDGRGERSDILKEQPHIVNTDNVSVQELACECLISLTHHQHNPQWLRHQLRLKGGLDILANLVISSIDDISSVDVEAFSSSSQSSTTCDYATGISNRLTALERRLKALEHATVRNKDNQSYLVVFDGSVLLSRIVKLVALFQKFMNHNSLRSISEHCLLTAFKVLLNLTHEFQFGCYRLGEQKHVMTVLLDVLFQLSDSMSDEDSAFDISILTLSLLINLTEMCDGNRTQLVTTKVSWSSDDDIFAGSQDSATDGAIYGNDSSLRALVQLFLKRFSKAEATQIHVPTPQRLSQLPPSSSPAQASPRQASQPDNPPPSSSSKRDLLSSFTSRMQKASSTTSLPLQSCSHEENSQSSQGSELSQDGGLNWLSEDPIASESKMETSEKPVAAEGLQTDDEEEEALERVEIDPLVFSREEFDAALHQAGRHMEDSVVAAYTALLLGILSKHDQDSLTYVRSCMPSQSFSEMIEILKKLVSFMNMTGSATGLESIKRIVKFLEDL